MHSGPFMVLRMWLLYAKPWQQLLICLTLVLSGVALIALVGHPSGVILAAFGVLFAIPVLRHLAGRPHAALRTETPEPSDRQRS